MSLNEEQVAELLAKSLIGIITDEEKQLLNTWIAAAPKNKTLYDESIKLNSLKSRLRNYAEISSDGEDRRILPYKIPLFRYRWIKYVAAACIVLVICSVAYYSIFKSNTSFVHETQQVAVRTDVPAPAFSRPILTLSNGQEIDLESVGNGTIARQGNVLVEKMDDGRIVYQGQGSNGQLQLNKLSNPSGSKVAHIELPDGSEVFLNASSEITFPAAFGGDERRVKIQGEVFFEVAKDKSKPFIVEAADQKIIVLGTHFNVKSNGGPEITKTTLLEGSIQVGDRIVKPGQAYLDGRIIQTNVEQDIAWKSGVFNFHKMTLKEVMPELSRWYNLEIEYQGDIPSIEFFGEMERDFTLMQVLKALESSGLKFQLTGNKLIVRY